TSESRIGGILKIDDSGQGVRFVADQGAVPAGGSPLAGGAAAPIAPLWLLLWLALLGGLVLNVMPCVFPILSLKALSLARAGADRAEARQEGLAYAGGSIVSALALGGVLITLRSAGEEIGWSFQLQSPHVVALLLALTTAIALNLAGLFEFCAPAINGGGAIRSGSRGAFATGALAAVIATPCSGPFMAGALGAALILSPPAALLIFAGLGLGMALPFLAIAWIPALQRRMPKPGKWMETFRRILSLPMLATAMALAWILGRQTGVGGMTIGLALAVVVGVSLWWLGNRQRENRPVWRTLVPAAAAVIAVLAVDLPQSDAATKQTRVDGRHQPFDVVRLQQLRAAGTPVFLDFTADWCLTCKVNEKLAINTDATRTAFRHAGVVTMIGDWTQGDPAITRFLEAHGRNSIPFYIYYPPAGEPQLLPQILTPALLSSLSSGQTGGS
ncbi:MAG TPA: thioredoxin family protein, partial [Nitrococcus sp.]|nr:thioredoxin family protein [Nitrococcus sp.]